MSEPTAYRYRPDILAALLEHGARPLAHTRPALVHEFVSDLYRYEIRRLRGRLLRQEFPRREYASRVIVLRRRYRIIALRPEQWLE